jgi:hypothetical protein
MVTKTCMMNCLTQHSVPLVYRNTIANEAVKATSASALVAALRAKGIPQTWIDIGVQCYYQCGGT